MVENQNYISNEQNSQPATVPELHVKPNSTNVTITGNSENQLSNQLSPSGQLLCPEKNIIAWF